MFSLRRCLRISGSSVSAPKYVDAMVVLSGGDELGLIHRLCRTVSSAEGNIGRTSMNRIGGDFTVMAVVHLQQARVDSLRVALEKEFPTPQFVTGLKETHVEAWSPYTGKSLETLKLLGPDSRGLIEALSKYIGDNGFDIVQMQSNVKQGSHVGYDIFEASMSVAVPRSVPREDIEKDLRITADKLGVEIETVALKKAGKKA